MVHNLFNIHFVQVYHLNKDLFNIHFVQVYHLNKDWFDGFDLMVFNTNFNNVSAISCQSYW